MATSTDAKIKPLQDKINDIQSEVSTLTNLIAKANADVVYYDTAQKKAKVLQDTYESRWKQAEYNFQKALTKADAILAKNRKVCGSGYYKGICKEAGPWKTEANIYQKRFLTAKNDRAILIAKMKARKEYADVKTAEKLAKQSEIADLQDQIDKIIADDIAVASTDPSVLVAAQEASTEQKKLEEEGKQRNLIILGVIVVVLVIGSIIAFRS